VDGKHVAGNDDAYRHVAARHPGVPVTYTLRDGATTDTVTVESQTFSVIDYCLVFGSYLVTGLLYLFLGVLAAWLLPDATVGRALLLVGGAGGIFALTGAGIYEAGADLRIHVLAESSFPATLLYLAATLARIERRCVACVGMLGAWISLAVAVPYEIVLFRPGAYSVMHGACETYLGLAGLAVGATLIVDRARHAETAGALRRAALTGAILGIGVPAVIMVLSGLSGGAVPVNLVTATAFLFPLCTAYGLWREHAASPRATAVAA
jgi:hypothetical protein